MTMQKIGVMQEFPREDKRRLRSQRAENEAQRNAARRRGVAQLAVKREAATAWLARRYAADAQRVIAEQIAEAELNVASVAAAYRAGRAPQAELIAAQSMLVELRNRATEAAAQSRRASIALARYIGADADRPPGDAPDISRLPFDVAHVPDPDLQPEVRVAQAQETMAADRGGARARREAAGLERGAVVRGTRFGLFEHGVADGFDRPAVVGRHSAGSRAAPPSSASSTRRARCARTCGGCAPPRSIRCSPNGNPHASRRSGRGTRCCRSPLQRRDAALAAYRGATGPLAAVLDARRGELDVRLNLIQQEQAAAKAWAWLRFALPVTEKS